MKKRVRVIPVIVPGDIFCINLLRNAQRFVCSGPVYFVFKLRISPHNCSNKLFSQFLSARHRSNHLFARCCLLAAVRCSVRGIVRRLVAIHDCLFWRICWKQVRQVDQILVSKDNVASYIMKKVKSGFWKGLYRPEDFPERIIFIQIEFLGNSCLQGVWAGVSRLKYTFTDWFGSLWPLWIAGRK